MSGQRVSSSFLSGRTASSAAVDEIAIFEQRRAEKPRALERIVRISAAW